MASNSDLTPSPSALHTYARQLERRYPDIAVHAEWIDQRRHGLEYTGWLVRYTGIVRALLAHGLTSQAELDYASAHRRCDLHDEFGHHRFISSFCPRGYALPSGSMSVGVHVPSTPAADEDRGAHTKKMQALVAKLVKRALATKGGAL